MLHEILRYFLIAFVSSAILIILSKIILQALLRRPADYYIAEELLQEEMMLNSAGLSLTEELETNQEGEVTTEHIHARPHISIDEAMEMHLADKDTKGVIIKAAEKHPEYKHSSGKTAGDHSDNKQSGRKTAGDSPEQKQSVGKAADDHTKHKQSTKSAAEKQEPDLLKNDKQSDRKSAKPADTRDTPVDNSNTEEYFPPEINFTKASDMNPVSMLKIPKKYIVTEETGKKQK